MSARLMVLGTIHQQKQAHGYKIYQELVSWQAETWSKVRRGSIYHALGQLEKEGLVVSEEPQTSAKGPAHTSYMLTKSGYMEMVKLIEKALVEYDQEWFAAGLAFMHELPRGRVIELIKQRLTIYQDTCDFMHTLPQEELPSTPAKHPEIIMSWTVLFEATVHWMEGFIERLEGGAYRFAGE